VSNGALSDSVEARSRRAPSLAPEPLAHGRPSHRETRCTGRPQTWSTIDIKSRLRFGGAFFLPQRTHERRPGTTHRAAETGQHG